MTKNQLQHQLQELVRLPSENEWVEFKHNYHSDEEIGERISALSNSACILGQEFGYLVFGVEDETHKILGTTFKAKTAKAKKAKKESLEHWLLQRLSPRIDFEIVEFDYEGKHISMFIIPATYNKPVEFHHTAYVRVGSTTRKLNDFPEKARKIWTKSDDNKFEETIALRDVTPADVVRLLDTQSYFDLLNIPYPTTQDGVIERFLSEGLITKNKGTHHITNLGALLFAKDLNKFDNLKRKAVRVIIYESKSKLKTIREQIGIKGYAVGFTGLVNWINSQLPANEVIGEALRKEVRMYPEIAVRELTANAIIHQNFAVKGFPTVEIFSDRIEISNPGTPLIHPERFIDEYQSRNEKTADLMRRLGICEEKGSGIDKVIWSNEEFRLPPPSFEIKQIRTVVTMYAQKDFSDMTKEEKIRACYQHCCLKYAMNERMTNETVRERFGMTKDDSYKASAIISATRKAGLVKRNGYNSQSRKGARYVPFWA